MTEGVVQQPRFFRLPAFPPGGLFEFQAGLAGGFVGRHLPLFGAQGVDIAEAGTADAAHDVHEVGHVVVDEKDIIHLLAELEGRHQQHRDRDAARKAGQRRQHDEHEDDAGGPQQGRAGEEGALQHARHQRREDDAFQQGNTAVLFFHRRADDEEQEHIVQEMIPACVAQHMPEPADIEQRILQRRAVDAEQVHGRPAVRPLAEEEHCQRQQKKGQDQGGVILELQSQFGAFRRRSILSLQTASFRFSGQEVLVR